MPATAPLRASSSPSMRKARFISWGAIGPERGLRLPRRGNVPTRLAAPRPAPDRVESRHDAHGRQSRHRGADRGARAGRGRGDRRRRRPGEGRLPGVARRRSGRPGPAAPPARDARRGAARGALAARVGERRQADLGCPRRDRHGGAGLPLLRRRGRQALRRDDPRRRRHRRHLPRAARRRRPDHAVELPAQHRELEDRPGARDRQHDRDQAGRADAADDDPARRARARGGHSRGRPERRRRQGLGRRPAPRRAPRRREDRLHRLDRGRPAA